MLELLNGHRWHWHVSRGPSFVVASVTCGRPPSNSPHLLCGTLLAPDHTGCVRPLHIGNSHGLTTLQCGCLHEGESEVLEASRRQV